MPICHLEQLLILRAMATIKQNNGSIKYKLEGKDKSIVSPIFLSSFLFFRSSEEAAFNPLPHPYENQRYPNNYLSVITTNTAASHRLILNPIARTAVTGSDNIVLN